MPTTNYIWDPEVDSYLVETDHVNSTEVTYTCEPVRYGSMISQRRDSWSNYCHFDILGSIRQLSDETQSISDTFDFDAWGHDVFQSGTTPISLRWIGKVGYFADSEVGSVYLRARTYQPTLGRFTGRDPMIGSGITGDNHFDAYAYANNSPIWRYDPSGLVCEFMTMDVPYIDPIRNMDDPPDSRIQIGTIFGRIDVWTNTCLDNEGSHYGIFVTIDPAVKTASGEYRCVTTRQRLLGALLGRIARRGGVSADFVGENIECDQPSLSSSPTGGRDPRPGPNRCGSLDVRIVCRIPCASSYSGRMCESVDGQAILTFRGPPVNDINSQQIVSYTGPGQQLKLRWSVSLSDRDNCCGFGSCTPHLDIAQYPLGFPRNPPNP